MGNAFTLFRPSSLASPANTAPGIDESTLFAVVPGRSARITSIGQEEELAAWLRAVGMREGANVTVLRRAPFGGPIHVRTSDGGEFAIHRDLARSIAVAAFDEVKDGQGGA